MGAQAGLDKGGKSIVQAQYGKRIGVTRMAILPLDADSARIDADAFEKTLEAVGITVCYRENVPLVQPDYTAIIVRMRQENCDGFYAIFDLNSAAKLQRDIFRQGWKPKYALYPLTIYEKRFVELAGGPQAAEGAHLYFDQLPLDEPNAQMRQLVSFLAKYYPNDDPANYGVVPNWADTLLFLEALKRSGPNPTRKRFLEELDKIRDFDAGGIYPRWPYSPLAKLAQPCWLVMVFKSGRWQRANAQTGFECGRVVK
jgi:branched-chain amino acid transport system substrate-binding protein